MSTEEDHHPQLLRQFRSALNDATDAAQHPSDELLPTLLAQAACAALGADGAGVSVFNNQQRVPLGASDASATAAERLQFTVGEGPCLAALANHCAIRVDDDQLNAEWPVYYAELRRETDYRSVVAVPLSLSVFRGALDVYYTRPTMPDYAAVTGATLLAGSISDLLNHSASASPSGEEGTPSTRRDPAWLNSPLAYDRLRLWIAVGVLMYKHDADAVDALTMLRAHAYGRTESIDDVATQLVQGEVRADEFGPGRHD